ncbi:MAG: hypothetical protein JO372_22990 [Solirubrobacterales bacterium]|nr:hypothetical protein [Solirubrobacterales bacterium]
MSFETVPMEPESNVWDGPLTPRLDLDEGAEKGGAYRQLRPEDLAGELPSVSIGRPEVLRSVKSTTPHGFRAIAERDFYLVRLWCSFRDSNSEIEFHHATFSIQLSCPPGQGPAVAHDMYPSEVLYKVERNKQVSLSPEVKFMEIGGSLGGIDFGFRYDELQPSIYAAGQGESTPTWAFSRTKGYKLRGGKALHLVVRAPADTVRCDAVLDLVAFVAKRNWLPLPMGLFERRGDVPAEPLRVRLW